jgi:hypothetical protein
MNKESIKNQRIGFTVTPETRSMLIKLSKLHDRSITSVFEQLIKKEAKEYGLIESRQL